VYDLFRGESRPEANIVARYLLPVSSTDKTRVRVATIHFVSMRKTASGPLCFRFRCGRKHHGTAIMRDQPRQDDTQVQGFVVKICMIRQCDHQQRLHGDESGEER
jgi:hypothetical protein